jgi:hypothetical protein
MGERKKRVPWCMLGQLQVGPAKRERSGPPAGLFFPRVCTKKEKNLVREEKRGLCCFIYFGKPPRAKVKKGKHPCAAAAVVVVIGCILSLLVFFSSRAKTTLK